MRRPLRYQIMLPMAAVMVAMVVSVSGVGVWLEVRAAKARIESQISELNKIVEDSNFPLTTPVLRQMRALSGGELVVVDGAGRVVAASCDIGDASILAHDAAVPTAPNISWRNRIELDGRSYFHSVAAIAPKRGDAAGQLHILYPEEEDRRASRFIHHLRSWRWPCQWHLA
jgi:hypothetical protein